MTAATWRTQVSQLSLFLLLEYSLLNLFFSLGEPDRNASQRAQSEPKPIFGAPFAVRVASDRFQPLPIGQIVADADKRKTITALNHSAELSENDHEFQASAPAKIVGREKRGEGDLGHAMSEADTSDRLKKLVSTLHRVT